MFGGGVSFLLFTAGQSDVSEWDEEILADEIDPIRGWRGRDDSETPPSPSLVQDSTPGGAGGEIAQSIYSLLSPLGRLGAGQARPELVAVDD